MLEAFAIAAMKLIPDTRRTVMGDDPLLLIIKALEDAKECIETLTAERDALRYALRIIAGLEQSADNLMSNVDVALAALKENRDEPQTQETEERTSRVPAV